MATPRDEAALAPLDDSEGAEAIVLDFVLPVAAVTARPAGRAGVDASSRHHDARQIMSWCVSQGQVSTRFLKNG